MKRLITAIAVLALAGCSTTGSLTSQEAQCKELNTYNMGRCNSYYGYCGGGTNYNFYKAGYEKCMKQPAAEVSDEYRAKVEKDPRKCLTFMGSKVYCERKQ